MLKQVIKKVIERNHFWRDVGFDELSELYVSIMLRSVALTIFMIFVPFYMYQNGYPAPAIFALYGWFFVVRFPSDIGAGYAVARFGPKHTMIISCVMQIINAAMLLSVPQIHWSIILLAIPWGAATSFFFISYHVELSKIKHSARAGHELGHLQVFEKLGYLVGPLIGGVIGTVLGPQYIFLAATVLLFGSLWPLFQTQEPTRIHQKLEYRLLPVDKLKRDFFTNTSLGVENTLGINAWAFYVSVFLLSGAVYSQLGALSAAGVLVSILAAKMIGRLSDTSLARPLMHLSLLINAGLHLVRPFVSGLGGVFAVNTVNDVVTAGYRMPFLKGVYAAADDLPGLRIVYISSLEAVSTVVKSGVWFSLALLALVFPLKTVLIISFIIAAAASIGVMQERFAVYNHGK